MKITLHFLSSPISFLLLIFFSANLSLQAQEEINVKGNIQSIPDGATSPNLLDRTDFGFAFITGGTIVHTFIIENLGTSDLTINSISGTGDFATIGALVPSSPIPAGDTATFTVTFDPSIIGTSTGTITIDNSDADEATYDFIVQGLGANTGMSSWDPLLYPPTPCSWTSQDNNATNSPYASWNLAVVDAESGGVNNVISLQPDAYVGSFDYDGANGNETCLGHQVATTLDVNAAQNGLQILGSTGGCLTFIDLSSGSASDQWGNFTNMNGLTIKNIYLRDWGGGINLTNCTNVLIEDCVFESCNNSVANAVFLSGCTNVTFRRCSFLGNVNPAGRAVRVNNSGTSGSRILFEDCVYGCNRNNGSGAALFVTNGSFVDVNGGVFSGNLVSAGGRGGAVSVAVGANAVFRNVNFMRNSCHSSSADSDSGGAIFASGSSGTPTTLLVDNCHFYQNTSTGSDYGGAISCEGGSSFISAFNVTISNSIFENNGANRGGAIYAKYSTMLIDNNLFLNNTASDLTSPNSLGGGIYLQSGGNNTISNNTFSNNLSADGQIGHNDAGAATVTNNNYNTQDHDALPNSGGTTGSTITPTSLVTTAPDYDCSTGAYCAITTSGSCLSNSQSSFICSPSATNSGSISGQVWDDANGDGIQEAGDNGIAGAFVLLYDESGYLIGRTTTDGSGNYLFSNILPGNYTVVFVNPSIPTYTFMSPANASGSIETTDSDQASETNINGELRGGTSSNISLAAGSNVTDVDAGFTAVDLPIELAYFSGKKQDKQSLLEWSTQLEINNQYFSIQRSNNGIQWEEIGTVMGAGNSTTIESYSFLDPAPFQGVNYYKLVQYDFDGSHSSSQVIAISHGTNTSSIIYPNPAKEYILLQSSEIVTNNSTIKLMNTNGVELFLPTKKMANNLVRIDLQGLQSGIYFISCGNEENIHWQKFIKQ